jgi:hypothetical protein
MSRAKTHTAGAAIAALVLLAACSDQVNPAGPQRKPPADAVQNANAEDQALVRVPASGKLRARPDRLSLRIAKQVPAFGGGFVKDGVLHVHIAEMAAAGHARSVIASEMRRGGRTDLNEVVFIPARYRFQQLESWHGRLSSGGGIPHPILYTEVDERENRVRIGIERAELEAVIRAELAKKQIPDEAVVFRVDVPAVPANHNLRDKVRPSRAGTQTRATYSGSPDHLVCTQGPNVWYQSRRHFVLNSHCTQDVDAYGWGGWTGAAIHQPNQGPWYNRNANRIGTEVSDPAFYQGYWCDPNQASGGCRWSDAALVENSNTDWDFAGIARPINRVFLPSYVGSLDINGTFPRIGMNDTWWTGDQLDKVGRTTGWTSGTVETTCRTVYLTSNQGSYGFICSGVVQAGGGSGDSGSPVFQFTSTSAHLAGIMFGIYASRQENLYGEWPLTGERFIFSRWEEVDWELGWYGPLTAGGNP